MDVPAGIKTDDESHKKAQTESMALATEPRLLLTIS